MDDLTEREMEVAERELQRLEGAPRDRVVAAFAADADVKAEAGMFLDSLTYTRGFFLGRFARHLESSECPATALGETIGDLARLREAL